MVPARVVCRSHTVSPYLVLTLRHVRSHTSCHMVHVYHPLSTSHTVSLYSKCIRQSEQDKAKQDNPPPSVPTLSHARFDAPPNAQVTSTAACCAAAAPTVVAHTLFCQPLLHYCCTIQHTAQHTDHCCTTTAPYSTPLVTPTSAAPCNRCCTDHCCTTPPNTLPLSYRSKPPVWLVGYLDHKQPHDKMNSRNPQNLNRTLSNPFGIQTPVQQKKHN